MPDPKFMEDVDNLSLPDMREMNKERRAAVSGFYNDYLSGEIFYFGPFTKAPVVDDIPAADLLVDVEYTNVAIGNIRQFSISRVSNAEAINFRCINRNQRCAAFKGELQFLDGFLKDAVDAFEHCHFKAAFQVHSYHIPLRNFRSGMCFEEFAGNIEIVEYVMWAKGSPDDKGMEVQNSGDVAMFDANLPREAESVHASSPLSSAPSVVNTPPWFSCMFDEDMKDSDDEDHVELEDEDDRFLTISDFPGFSNSPFASLPPLPEPPPTPAAELNDLAPQDAANNGDRMSASSSSSSTVATKENECTPGNNPPRRCTRIKLICKRNDQ